MDSPETSSPTKMDKIRVVVEYNELIENQKAEFLKKNGIDEKTLKNYQNEAASILGIPAAAAPAAPSKPKTRCEELIEELQHHNENIRRDVVKELGKMRYRATDAVDALIDRMLNDPIDFVRSWSAWALTRVEPRNPKTIKGFLKGLAEDEESVNTRNWCVVGLSVSDCDDAMNSLIEILHAGKPYAQFAAIEVLSNVKTNSPQFIAGLEIALQSTNPSLKKFAEEQLSELKSED